jgi:hypothetical protein
VFTVQELHLTTAYCPTMIMNHIAQPCIGSTSDMRKRCAVVLLKFRNGRTFLCCRCQNFEDFYSLHIAGIGVHGMGFVRPMLPTFWMWIAYVNVECGSMRAMAALHMLQQYCRIWKHDHDSWRCLSWSWSNIIISVCFSLVHTDLLGSCGKNSLTFRWFLMSVLFSLIIDRYDIMAPDFVVLSAPLHLWKSLQQSVESGTHIGNEHS